MKSGEIFGELLCFQEKKYPNWIVSKNSSEVALIPRKVLYELLKSRDFFNSFMNLIGNKSQNLLSKIDILSLKKVEERIAYYLINFKDYTSIKDLSSSIGCSREATSRALSKLKKEIDLTSIEELESILYGGYK